MEEKPKNGSDDVLTLLSIFHYVYGGFQMLLSLIGVLYVFLGVAMGTGSMAPSKGSPPPEALGWIFGGIGVVVTLLFLALGVLAMKAGGNIRRRQGRMFCLVTDAILCLMVPFGTIVGIFGLIVLTRSGSMESFTG